MEDNEKLARQVLNMLKKHGIEHNGSVIKADLTDIMKKYTIIKNETGKRYEFSDIIDNFITIKRIDGLSELTLTSYTERLTRFSLQVKKPVNRITTDDIRAYISYLSEERKLARTTIATDINIIRNFFNWIHTEGILKANPCTKIKGLKIDKKGLRKALTQEELERLRNACETIREKTIVEMLRSTGCRVSEMVNVNLEDINFMDRSITVVGKGNKRRTVYFSVKAKLFLEDYLKSSKRTDNALFTCVKKPYARLGTRTLQTIIRELGVRAGLAKKVHPHLLRHTFACLALDAGMDIIIIQQLLGHEDIGTTTIYAEISQISVKQAYCKFIA